MTLASALTTGDLTQLPSRRDEDWRWTDLRGLIRAVPPASPTVDGAIAKGPFDGLAADEILFVNGRQRPAAAGAAGEVVALRFVSASEGAAHAAAHAIVVQPGATLVLLESHEGRAGGYFSDVTLD